MANVYYNPEKFGLTVVGELNDPWASYDFNDLVVWKHEEGGVYWATDSGCSCPTPFETYNSLDDLHEVTAASWSEFQQAVEGHCARTYGMDASAPDPQAADKTDLLRKVSALVPF